MECTFNMSLCRLCLRYDVSFVDIFKDDASQEYNLTSVILELLELKVSERDGYPKALCSDCFKTIIDFKKFKKECQQAKITYDKNIRMQEITDVYRRSQEIDNGIEETSVRPKFEIHIDNYDMWGNLITEDSEREVIVPAVVKKEDDLDEFYHENATLTAASHNDVDEYCNSIDRKTSVQDCHKCSMCGMEFHLLSQFDLHLKSHSVTSSSSEQNDESRFPRPTDLKQKEVNRVTLNVNLLNDERRRTLDLESKSHESNDTTSVGLLQTVTGPKLDKSKEDEIEWIQQGDSLIASEFQSGRMTTIAECNSFDKEKEDNVGWKLRNSDFKKGKDDEGEGMFARYDCDHCSKVFNDIRSLNIHLSLHERDLTIVGKEVISSNTEVNKNANDKDGKISHNCGVCGKRFKGKYNLKVHMRTHSGETPYKCHVCSQMFRHKSSLGYHLMHIHESYRCIYCNKSFPVKDKLSEHIQECRIKSKFSCNQCNVFFGDRLSLNEHLRMHTKEKVFKCHYCDKYFSTKQVLSVHERIHTGEKPFICSVCGKSFRYQSNFIVHIRIHTNDKRHKCGYCTKSFIQRVHLRRHERTHTKEKSFKCSFCDKSFSDKSYVKEHEQIHLRGKEFGCSFCGKHFSRRSNLKKHEAIHLKIKSFECSICKKSFRWKSSLRIHMKVHIN